MQADSVSLLHHHLPHRLTPERHRPLPSASPPRTPRARESKGTDDVGRTGARRL